MFDTTVAPQPTYKLKLLPVGVLILLAAIVAGGILAFFALLTAFAIFSLSGSLDLGKVTKAESDIVGLKTSLTIYKLKNHGLPTTEQGLKALIALPTVEPVPAHWEQTQDTLILDPWGNPYQYSFPGKHNPDSFDVYSLGPDGLPGTADDIGNWKSSTSK
jgi:general secretion pathway protein G